MAVVVKTNGIPFWDRCTSQILEPILVGIGMFTGGTENDPWPYVLVSLAIIAWYAEGELEMLGL